MSNSFHWLRGPLFMVLATGCYVINDTMMKLATEGLPPYEVLALRGISATTWGLLLLALLGKLGGVPMAFGRWVVLRNVLELTAVLGFILALANMPIADVQALGQVTPLIVLLAASILFKERLGAVSMVLIAAGFAGALLVAQPTGEGISIYALLALSNAVFCALRDIVGRRVPGDVPGIIVAFGASLVVLVGAAIAHFLFEQTIMPNGRHLMLLAGSGLFLFAGHYLIFMSYRIGPTSSVAPFYYFFTFWALISGLVVFDQFPNTLAVIGIVLVVASGVIIVVLEKRRYKPIPVA